MANVQIANLGELLRSELTADEEIASYHTAAHTQIGENFASIVVSLNVDIRDSNTGRERTLYLVGKMIPENVGFRNVMTTKVTFLKEIDFYKKAIPAMLKLQRDCHVPENDLVSNIFPKFIDARPKSGNENDVDHNAVILLENLHKRGYTLRDKKPGLDFEHSKLVMQKIAFLHALPIALRRNFPAEFKASIEPAAKFFKRNQEGADREAWDFNLADICRRVFRKMAIEPEIIEAAVKTTDEMNYGSFPDAVEPFITISHEDLWINNMLFKAGPDNEPAALMFVDFEATRLLSPMLDFVFFMYTSVNTSVRRKHFDQLFDIYYQSFCNCLQQVNCDPSDFTKAGFAAELDRIAGSRLYEIFSRSRIIVVDPVEITRDTNWYFNADLGGADYFKWLEDVVLEFNDRGWLKK